MMTTTKAKSNIYSHPDLACPETASCPWCGTWFHTISDVLAAAWLTDHLQTCKERKPMATAGPLKDATGIDIGSRGDNGGWTVRCSECKQLLAEGEKQEDMAGQPVREAINRHTCTGKRRGRITED